MRCKTVIAQINYPKADPSINKENVQLLLWLMQADKEAATSLQLIRWDVCCEVRGPGRTTKIDEKAQTNEQNQTRAALSAPPGVSRRLGCHSNRETSSSHLHIWGRVREVFGLHVWGEQRGSASFIPMEKQEEALVEWASSFLLS